MAQFQPLNHGTPTSTGNHRPSIPGLVAGPGGTQDTGLPGLDGATWAGMGYQGIQLLQTGHDASSVLAQPGPVHSVNADTVLGKRPAEIDGEDRGDCPLPFLRDISTVRPPPARCTQKPDTDTPPVSTFLTRLVPTSGLCLTDHGAV